MRISSEKKPWGTVVKVSGSLDALTRKQFEEQPSLQSRVCQVALDLTALDFMDSTGLGALVQLIRLFQESGKRLILVNPAEGVLGVLRMTSVDQIVPIVDNVDRAAEILEKQPAT